ncbi:RraA family protein [Planococcus beigongshangi]|uniref:RraA family protein n=1 Tax=Planococcus beigongshangi TaxID=2782536 RepID=UPI00193BA27F
MEQIITSFKELDTSTISDALDKIGVFGQCFGVRSINPEWKIVGRAFTVKYSPVDLEPGTVGDFIDDVEPGDVVVLDNNGRLDCTVWGDILTGVAKRRGIAGTVIDGVCRDTHRSIHLDYPVFSTNRYMRTGKGRVQIETVGETINISNVIVKKGDIIVGDADGVVVVPKIIEQQVLDEAKRIANAEDRIRDAIENGMRLDEARKHFNYHHLQKGE